MAEVTTVAILLAAVNTLAPVSGVVDRLVPALVYVNVVELLTVTVAPVTSKPYAPVPETVTESPVVKP